MPRIPVYEQGQLASAAVGTPGVNTAGAAAWNALATEADRATNTMLQVVQARHNEQIAEARRLQAKIDADAKEQKRALDSAERVQKATAADQDLDAVREQQELDNRNTPESMFPSFIAASKLLLDKHLKLIADDDPDAATKRAWLTEDFSRSVRQASGVLANKATTYRTENTVNTFKMQANDLAVQAGNASSAEAMFEAIDKFEAAQKGPVGSAMGSGNFGLTMQSVTSQSAKNYLANVAQTNPDSLDAEVKYIRSTGRVDSTDLNSAYGDAVQIANSRKRELKEIEDTKNTQNRVSGQVAAIENTLNPEIPPSQKLNNINSMITGLQEVMKDPKQQTTENKEYLSSLVTQRNAIQQQIKEADVEGKRAKIEKAKAIYNSQEASDARGRAAAFAQQNGLVGADGKSAVGGSVDAREFKAATQYLQIVTDMHNKGYIDDKDYSKKVQSINTVVGAYGGRKGGFMGTGLGQAPSNAAVETLHSWVKQSKTSDAFKSDWTYYSNQKFADDFGRYVQIKGQEPTGTVLNKLRDRAYWYGKHKAEGVQAARKPKKGGK